MAQFKVGDVLIYDKGLHEGTEYEVTAVERNHYEITREDYCGTHSISTLEGLLILKIPANPNHITLSSLDYMTSTEITQEDKEIIKEHLEHA